LNVLVTADRLSHDTNAALKPFGISKEQFNVLRILKGQFPNPASLQLISERMISKSSNATRLVEKLRQKEFIERTECPSDRRQVDIILTQKGIEFLDIVNPLVKASSAKMRNLTNSESAELNRLLEKMRVD
jgi:DNA-binding MarR family transcriptional regulator